MLRYSCSTYFIRICLGGCCYVLYHSAVRGGTVSAVAWSSAGWRCLSSPFSPSGACTRERRSAMMCPTPGVCTGSGGNDMLIRRMASSRATTAIVVLGARLPSVSRAAGGRIFTSSVSAPTLSPRTFNTTLDCNQWVAQMSIATKMAKLSHSCWP